ncbi:MAG TPA: TolC family protein [Longimicrobiales bacterium]|nr:TolC family protein [Longimicrobiales bacterium]
MMSRVVSIAWLVAALAATVTPLAAQQPGGTLTLDEALRIARDQNPAFQRARNDVDPAGMAVRAAWASAFLPSLNASMGFNGSQSTAVTGLDPFNQVVRLEEPRRSRGSGASQGISAGITLFDGLASIRNLQAQRADLDGTESAIAAQEVQLVAQVSREYYQAVRTLRLITLEETLLASARDRLTSTEALLRLAARNRVDVLGARADVAQFEQAVERARGEADKARLTLAATLGLDPTTSFTVVTELPEVFDPADLDADVLVATALAGSPVIRQREAAVAAATQRVAAARGRRLPTISGNVSYNRSVNQPGYGAWGEFNPLNYGYSFGVSASLPVFSRFQTSANIASAAAAAEDADHDLRGARLNLERDVRSALIDLENAYRSLQLAEQNAELSRERQELTQEQYRLGGINFTELQNVIDRTAQAERQALDARFQFITAVLNLEERLGRSLGS